MNNLHGKSALVVGASSGIGLSVAALLADEGAHVLSVARRSCPDERVESLRVDIADPNSAQAAVLHAARDERLDILVYSAGFSMAAPVEHVDANDYRYLFEVNFFGALRTVEAAIPYMKENGGRIVLVSSLGGSLPILFDTFYSCSKAALDMLAKSLRAELKPYNILTTAVQPGGTATDFTFKRKVYPADRVGDYAPRLNGAVNQLADMEQSGMTPAAVAQTVLKVLRAPNPPILTASGFKNNLISISDKLLPLKLTDRINTHQYLQ